MAQKLNDGIRATIRNNARNNANVSDTAPQTCNGCRQVLRVAAALSGQAPTVRGRGRPLPFGGEVKPAS